MGSADANPPVVGSKVISQRDSRISFLQASGGIHTAGAARAGGQWERSWLVVLKDTHTHPHTQTQLRLFYFVH